jgi:hypothetical protein
MVLPSLASMLWIVVCMLGCNWDIRCNHPQRTDSMGYPVCVLLYYLTVVMQTA